MEKTLFRRLIFMELLHVLGNTYAAVAATALLPVYKLNDRDVVLIDTGYAKLDRSSLTNLIDQQGWRVRAVLCSHAHFDHTGNVRYLQERYGAKAAIYLIEAGISVNPVRRTVSPRPFGRPPGLCHAGRRGLSGRLPHRPGPDRRCQAAHQYVRRQGPGEQGLPPFHRLPRLYRRPQADHHR